MNKLLNKPVILQMICAILMMFLIHNIFINKAYKEIISKIISRNLPEIIHSIEHNNAILLGIYMTGDVDKDIELFDENMKALSFIAWELDDVINVKKKYFRFWHFINTDEKLDLLKKKRALSEADLLYIKNVQAFNQECIDLYYEILDKEGIDADRNFLDEDKAILVYKEFIKGLEILESKETYKQLDSFEINFDEGVGASEIGDTEVSVEPKISKEEGEILAENLMSCEGIHKSSYP